MVFIRLNTEIFLDATQEHGQEILCRYEDIRIQNTYTLRDTVNKMEWDKLPEVIFRGLPWVLILPVDVRDTWLVSAIHDWGAVKYSEAATKPAGALQVSRTQRHTHAQTQTHTHAHTWEKWRGGVTTGTQMAWNAPDLLELTYFGLEQSIKK